MIKSGAEIIDIGGESTRPGSKTLNSKIEWIRIEKIVSIVSSKINQNYVIGKQTNGIRI